MSNSDGWNGTVYTAIIDSVSLIETGFTYTAEFDSGYPFIGLDDYSFEQLISVVNDHSTDEIVIDDCDFQGYEICYFQANCTEVSKVIGDLEFTFAFDD